MQGISVKGVKLTGDIATISADNLGSHQIGGFREVFNSDRICRNCMVLSSKLRNILMNVNAR